MSQHSFFESFKYYTKTPFIFAIVNYNIEILLTTQTFIFFTKDQPFNTTDDINLKRSIFQFHFNFTLKSSLLLLSNRLVLLFHSIATRQITHGPVSSISGVHQSRHSCAVSRISFNSCKKRKALLKLYCI